MTGSVLGMLMAVVGGLGIFMLGMKYMSEGMQAIAGNSLRRMISLVTDNRFLATATGIGMTLLVQSSTITTVIVVGFANAGLMQLHQTIGVIMGANIGTTITGWILVLKVGRYGLPLLGVAALFYLFIRRDRPRFISMSVMGLGMIFFGLELMKEGFAPMKDMPAFIEAFAWFQADSYLGVLKAALVGCVLTLIVQSSSATLGITIGLAATGVIPFATAAALVLGENLGTTVTVVLAAIGANVNAKRAAAAHVVFNLIGVFWITLIFGWYIRVVAGIVDSVHGSNPLLIGIGDFADPLEYGAVITAGIALTHTLFNVANTVFFLPWVRGYGRMLERLFPDPRVKEVSRLRHMDGPGLRSPVLGLEQSRGEVLQMAEGVEKMYGWIRELAYRGPWDERMVRKTFHREEILDSIQREIVAFLTDVLDANVSHAVADEGRQQLRIAHEYESASDRLASILKGFVHLREQRLELTDPQSEELLELHDEVGAFFRTVGEAYARRVPLADADAQAMNTGIKLRVRAMQDRHMQRMIEGEIDPGLTMVYAALLTDYRRLRAHALNIHEATAEVLRADV